MQVAVPKTEQEFLELLDVAKGGEEVIIAHDQTPVAKIVPLEPAVDKRRFKHGILKDVLKGPVPDFLEPMSEEDLRLWEGRD